MKELIERIQVLEQRALQEIAHVDTANAAEAFRVKYLGRKGNITALFQELGKVQKEDRPEVGRHLNELRVKVEEKIAKLSEELSRGEEKRAVTSEHVDISLPGRKFPKGSQHPLTQVMQEVVDIFTDLGFSIHEGPEIETDYYNFKTLNFPKGHPARDMHDTFYVDDGRLLRTHTSPVQIHVMEKMQPPVMIIAPGAVYRCDSDVSHSPMFHQVEGLLVDAHVTFGDLKGILSQFCHRCFGDDLPVRFRPSFFPFTEPSAELDIGCVMCKGKGCRVCKQSGWVEILGCGMVDPEVFKAVKYDPKKVTGFAFGMGIERITMLKYCINDIRLFFDNDLRFLHQF